MRKVLYLSHHYLDLPDRGTSMKRHLIELKRHSLAAIVLLFIVSLMSPTGAVAAPPSCDEKPNHPKCGGGGDDGGGKSSALYTVDVYFGDEVVFAGGATSVDGSGNKKRQSIGDVDMNLDLTQLSSALEGNDCETDFGIVNTIEGEFAIGTARLSKSGEITYVTASFWNFTVNGSVYFLVFGPGDDGTIDDEGNWHPAGDTGDDNFLYGDYLELQVINGPAKNGPCDRLNITLAWNILVTKE